MSKSILILGASSEVGLNLCKKLSPDNKIFAHYNNNSEALQKIDGNVELLKADLNSNDDIVRLLDSLPNKLDEVYILQAYKFEFLHFKKIDLDECIKDINIQQVSTLKILNSIIPKMSQAKSGFVFFMLSDIVHNPIAYVQAYQMSKFALLGLFHSLNLEYSKKGLVFKALAPGMIDTKFLKNVPDPLINPENILSVDKVVQDIVEIRNNSALESGYIKEY